MYVLSAGCSSGGLASGWLAGWLAGGLFHVGGLTSHPTARRERGRDNGEDEAEKMQPGFALRTVVVLALAEPDEGVGCM